MSDVTPAIQAEAAAWIARLHAPERSRRLEAGFRAWLTADAAHARAFEATTQAWEVIDCVPRERLSSMVRWERIGSRSRRPLQRGLSVAAAVALIGGLTAAYLLVGGRDVSTAVGEQRTLTLVDGSRVQLNTSSRITLRFSERERLVELTQGEAMFEVARHPRWPFVVTAGDSKVRALGTAFVVRRNADVVVVTLVEGRVAVTSPQSPERILAPGERVTFGNTVQVRVDRPALDSFTAWRRGQVVLDGTRLDAAIAEMNRYSVTPMRVEDVRASQLRVSGLFRAGDSLSFARAVATTYRLDVEERDGAIVLRGAPQAAYQQGKAPH